MKSIPIVDDAENCVYDIFAASDDEFALLYPLGQDVAFISEVYRLRNGLETQKRSTRH